MFLDFYIFELNFHRLGQYFYNFGYLIIGLIKSVYNVFKY